MRLPESLKGFENVTFSGTFLESSKVLGREFAWVNGLSVRTGLPGGTYEFESVIFQTSLEGSNGVKEAVQRVLLSF